VRTRIANGLHNKVRETARALCAHKPIHCTVLVRTRIANTLRIGAHACASQHTTVSNKDTWPAVYSCLQPPTRGLQLRTESDRVDPNSLQSLTASAACHGRLLSCRGRASSIHNEAGLWIKHRRGKMTISRPCCIITSRSASGHAPRAVEQVYKKGARAGSRGNPGGPCSIALKPDRDPFWPVPSAPYI